MAAKNKPPNEIPNNNVVTDDKVHERRVKKLIERGVAAMESGQNPIFPMHQLIRTEADLMELEIAKFERKQTKSKREKDEKPKRH